MNTDYLTYLDHPELRDQIMREARRQRAQEMGRALGELLKGFFSHHPARDSRRDSRMLRRSTAW